MSQLKPSGCLICFHRQGATFCSCARSELLALNRRHMRGIVCVSPSVCFSWRTAGQILMKFGVRYHVEAAFPKGISHVATWIKSDCKYGGVPGSVLLKMRIGLNFVKSELIFGSVRLCEFWAVCEDSGLLACDALLLSGCWRTHFQRSRRIRRNVRLCFVQVIQKSAPLIYVIFDVVLTAVTKNYFFMRCDAVWIGRYIRSGETWLPQDAGCGVRSTHVSSKMNSSCFSYTLSSYLPNRTASYLISLILILY
jgi:hypothetical protein